MSGLAIVFVTGFIGVTVYGIWMGCKGMFSEAPPFMQGEGNRGRYDARLSKHADDPADKAA